MWSVAKALHIPLDVRIKELIDVPYTISYAIRKRQQLDNLYELPKDKRPPEDIIWDGTSEDIDEWLDRVFKTKESGNGDALIAIDEIEG